MSSMKHLASVLDDLEHGHDVDLFDAAHAYILNGWTITLVGDDKRPIGKWGAGGWNRFDESNMHKLRVGRATGIGVITGPSGLVVLDYDQADVFDLVASTYGEHDTRIARTPRGYHAYFSAPDGVTLKPRQNIIPGLDVRAAESYIILPPSIMSHGSYAWHNAKPISELPANIIPLIS
jgi:hypothetical protein